MLELLSKIKDGCHREGVDLIHSEINGDAIKLACCVNGRRDTELNAYIIPDGDGFNFYTVSPLGKKSEPVTLKEENVIPTLVAALNPGKEGENVTKVNEDPTEGKVDIVTIEVEEGVTDVKEVAHNTYKNSRYAYSDKYHRMGTIIGIEVK